MAMKNKDELAAMDDDNSYIATTSQEFKSRELDAFGATSRFKLVYSPMVPHDWVNAELMPFLRVGYEKRPEIGDDHDFWEDIRVAEFIEPAHMVS